RFNMADDSHMFRTAEELKRDGWSLVGNVFVNGRSRMLPLYEAKMVYYFDHRLGTYQGQTEAQANVGTLPRLDEVEPDAAQFLPMARYWVANQEIDARYSERWSREWLLGWRDITNAGNERTLIASALPRTAVGHTLPLLFPDSFRGG